MCGCIEHINTELAPDHCLNTSMSFKTKDERPIINLIRRDRWVTESRRGKRSYFVCNFCPFCGEKYPETAQAVEVAA
ncbi:hypothetical protein GCM10011273_17370 [Asticcacaulis endophyticus]|uniref:Uncharacterized protein n=1 Tax=Asticcacaulis endophyticus TaxID=1395890 RepID=A0A918Q5Y1_9CAUL|nr:hypothetical protein GCM10011273_17370 [Asticcacaulis endophyticus]